MQANMLLHLQRWERKPWSCYNAQNGTKNLLAFTRKTSTTTDLNIPLPLTFVQQICSDMTGRDRRQCLQKRRRVLSCVNADRYWLRQQCNQSGSQNGCVMGFNQHRVIVYASTASFHYAEEAGPTTVVPSALLRTLWQTRKYSIYSRAIQGEREGFGWDNGLGKAELCCSCTSAVPLHFRRGGSVQRWAALTALLLGRLWMLNYINFMSQRSMEDPCITSVTRHWGACRQRSTGQSSRL